MAAGDSARGADGLPERAVELDGVLPVGRNPARSRAAGTRSEHPRAPRGTAAHQQPSGLARNARHGSRRRLGDAVLLSRARAAAQHQRVACGFPSFSQLHAGRRASRGPPARLSRCRPRVSRPDAAEARRVRRSPDSERDLHRAHPERREDFQSRRRGLRTGGTDRARRRCRLRRAQVLSVPRIRDVPISRSRPGPRATCTRATSCAWPRCARA